VLLARNLLNAQLLRGFRIPEHLATEQKHGYAHQGQNSPWAPFNASLDLSLLTGERFRLCLPAPVYAWPVPSLSSRLPATDTSTTQIPVSHHSVRT